MLDQTVTLDSQGRLSDRGQRAVRAALTHLAPETEGETREVRVRIGPKLRSGAQNRLYWGQVLPAVAFGYLDAGQAFPVDALHVFYKGWLLPQACAEAEAETGAPEEFETWHTLPDGSSCRTLTTTALSVAAFTLYLDRIAEHAADELGVDVFATVEDRRVRSGRLEEPHGLRTLAYDTVPAPAASVDAPDLSLDAEGQEGMLAALFDTTGTGDSGARL